MEEYNKNLQEIYEFAKALKVERDNRNNKLTELQNEINKLEEEEKSLPEGWKEDKHLEVEAKKTERTQFFSERQEAEQKAEKSLNDRKEALEKEIKEKQDIIREARNYDIEELYDQQNYNYKARQNLLLEISEYEKQYGKLENGLNVELSKKLKYRLENIDKAISEQEFLIEVVEGNPLNKYNEYQGVLDQLEKIDIDNIEDLAMDGENKSREYDKAWEEAIEENKRREYDKAWKEAIEEDKRREYDKAWKEAIEEDKKREYDKAWEEAIEEDKKREYDKAWEEAIEEDKKRNYNKQKKEIGQLVEEAKNRLKEFYGKEATEKYEKKSGSKFNEFIADIERIKSNYEMYIDNGLFVIANTFKENLKNYDPSERLNAQIRLDMDKLKVLLEADGATKSAQEMSNLIRTIGHNLNEWKEIENLTDRNKRYIKSLSEKKLKKEQQSFGKKPTENGDNVSKDTSGEEDISTNNNSEKIEIQNLIDKKIQEWKEIYGEEAVEYYGKIPNSIFNVIIDQIEEERTKLRRNNNR